MLFCQLKSRWCTFFSIFLMNNFHYKRFNMRSQNVYDENLFRDREFSLSYHVWFLSPGNVVLPMARKRKLNLLSGYINFELMNEHFSVSRSLQTGDELRQGWLNKLWFNFILLLKNIFIVFTWCLYASGEKEKNYLCILLPQNPQKLCVFVA